MDTIVHVISEEILKPSSHQKTPHQLKNVKLSLLDQLVPPVYIPLIFFYGNSDITNRAQIAEKLKRSLSKTLTAFYLLAGRLDQKNLVVDCNDAGVKYVEARVHARLLDIIRDPRTEKLKQYLPVLASKDDRFVLALQINFFDCGGFAIGVCLSHLISDGVSLVAFMNSWAATCRDQEDKFPNPNFDLASYFPARDLSNTNMISLSSLTLVKETIVTQRFVFDKEKLKALRVAATSSESTIVKDPTRVELVSSFIWKCFIEIGKLKKPNTSFSATQAVNLRKRTGPPHYLEHVFGNCIMNGVAIFDKGNDHVPELQDLVRELRNAIRAVDNDYIRRSQSQDEHGYLKELDKCFGLVLKGELEFCGFSSWCRFPVYDVDYGWGRPAWVGTTSFPIMNCTVLMDTRSGDGIEAWISTLHDNIESLEKYFKLILPNAEMDVNVNH